MTNNSKPIPYFQSVPEIFARLQQVHESMEASGFDRSIQHLVQLRASQINGCAHCIKMHTRDAREDGESSERLDRLIVWRHVNDFSPQERAALAWTEALTLLDGATDYGLLRSELRQHYNEQSISVLTVAIAMINLWNRIQVSAH